MVERKPNIIYFLLLHTLASQLNASHSPKSIKLTLSIYANVVRTIGKFKAFGSGHKQLLRSYIKAIEFTSVTIVTNRLR